MAQWNRRAFMSKLTYFFSIIFIGIVVAWIDTTDGE